MATAFRRLFQKEKEIPTVFKKIEKELTELRKTGVAPADLTEAAEAFEALTPNVQRNCLSFLRNYYKKFTFDEKGIKAWIDAQVVKEKVTSGTIKQGVYRARKWASLFNQPLTDEEYERVSLKLKRAVRNTRKNGRGPAEGASWELVDEAVKLAQKEGGFLGLRAAAILSVMSDCGLRSQEVSDLDVEDITENKNGSGNLTIRFSKTDQDGKGTRKDIRKETMACVRAWLACSRRKTGPLFLVQTGKKAGQRLSAKAVSAVCTNWLEKVDPGNHYSGHSVRRGFAASMARHGASTVAIQIAGRWQSSEMVLRYCEGQLDEFASVLRYRYGT